MRLSILNQKPDLEGSPSSSQSGSSSGQNDNSKLAQGAQLAVFVAKQLETLRTKLYGLVGSGTGWRGRVKKNPIKAEVNKILLPVLQEIEKVQQSPNGRPYWAEQKKIPDRWLKEVVPNRVKGVGRNSGHFCSISIIIQENDHYY